MVNLPIYNSSPCLIIRYNNEVWLLNMFCASAQNIYEKKKNWPLYSCCSPLQKASPSVTRVSLSFFPSATLPNMSPTLKRKITKESPFKAGLGELQPAFPENLQCYPLWPLK